MSEGDNISFNIVMGLLGVAFVVLKLCRVVAWSWWWVTVPFWGPFAVALAVILVGLLVVWIREFLKELWS